MKMPQKKNVPEAGSEVPLAEVVDDDEVAATAAPNPVLY
jgi:hypothetical protein